MCIIEGVDIFSLYILIYFLVFFVVILNLDKRLNRSDIFYFFVLKYWSRSFLIFVNVRNNEGYRSVL